MSFWRSFGLDEGSVSIDRLLESPDCTLEDLYNDDNLVNECSIHNRPLIDFLCKPDILERIVSYISDPSLLQSGAADDNDEDDKEVDRSRYPYTSCEILHSNVWQITNAVCSDPKLLTRLYGFLLSETPSQQYHKSACLCLKVIFSFLDHSPSDNISFLKGIQGIVNKFINKIQVSEVSRLLVKLISCSNETDFANSSFSKWLCDEGLLERLVEKFELAESPSEEQLEVASCVMDTLKEIILSQQSTSPVILHFSNGEASLKLLNLAFVERDTDNTIRCYCAELLTEVVRKTPAIEFESPKDSHPLIITALCSYLPSLLRHLGDTSLPQLGRYRLLLVELLEVLWRQNTRHIYDQIIHSGALKRLLDLFFAYKWNNFLHEYVHNVIVTGLQLQYSDLLYPYLFCDCNIVERILAAEAENKVYNEDGLKKGSNLGFIGHITRISWLLDGKNHFSNESHRYLQGKEDRKGEEETSEAKNDSILSKWKEYIKNTVLPRLERESIFLGMNASPNTTNSSSGNSRNNNQNDFNDTDDNDSGVVDYDDDSMSAYGSFEPSDFYSRVTKEVESEELYEIYDAIDIDRSNAAIGSSGLDIDGSADDDDPIDHLFYELNSKRFSHLKMHYNFGNGYDRNESDDASDENAHDYDVIDDDDDDNVNRIDDFYDEDENENENENENEEDDDVNELGFEGAYNDEDASDAMIHMGAVNIAHNGNGDLYINDDGEYTFLNE